MSDLQSFTPVYQAGEMVLGASSLISTTSVSEHIKRRKMWILGRLVTQRVRTGVALIYCSVHAGCTESFQYVWIRITSVPRETYIPNVAVISAAVVQARSAPNIPH